MAFVGRQNRVGAVCLRGRFSSPSPEFLTASLMVAGMVSGSFLVPVGAGAGRMGP